jgi:hypothetical protein
MCRAQMAGPFTAVQGTISTALYSLCAKPLSWSNACSCRVTDLFKLWLRTSLASGRPCYPMLTIAGDGVPCACSA